MKTSELTGAALDWAVAKCEGVHITFGEHGPSGQWEMYSSNWSQGGPIIEREWLHVEPWPSASVEEHRWSCTQYDLPVPIGTLGPTPLIAAMRCYVASKLGENVEVPKELK